MASPMVSPPTIPGTGKGDFLTGVRSGLKRAEFKAPLAAVGGQAASLIAPCAAPSSAFFKVGGRNTISQSKYISLITRLNSPAAKNCAELLTGEFYFSISGDYSPDTDSHRPEAQMCFP